MTRITHTLKPTVTTVCEIEPGAFAFNADRRFQWLQRLALWALRKLKCEYTKERERYAMIDINADDILDIVMEQRRAINAVYNQRAGYIVLGRRQMERLNVDATRSTSFTIPLDFDEHDRDTVRLAGMRIVLVPWFDGVVVLPEDL